MTTRSRWALVLLLSAAGVSQAKSFAIDFSSQAGLESTCPPLLAAGPRSVSRDEDRTAFAICSGLSLATDAMTWLRGDAPQVQLQQKEGRDRIRARLESFLLRLTQARIVLEGVKAKNPLFVIEPGNWSVDFDGDGTVSLHERHFFWTPKRGLDMHPMSRAVSEAAYRESYVAPVIRIDASDIHWALAYCNFAEAALHLLLSYDLAEGDVQRIVLMNRERVRTSAYPRLREGIRRSRMLRESLLAETDDDREWIPNPRQTHTSFPLVMDERTFATWGSLLSELHGLVEGKTLLGGRVDPEGRQGLGDLTFGLCRPGQGIDLRDIFLKPLRQAMDHNELASRCVAPAAKPMSGLAALITASIRRNSGAQPDGDSGEWKILRHLYWVN